MLILLSFILILGILIYLVSVIKNKESSEKGGNDNLQNKLNEVSSDINKIELDLASVSAPINELNRFLGGNVTTGRLGEWSMEEIVRDILPSTTYEFKMKAFYCGATSSNYSTPVQFTTAGPCPAMTNLTVQTFNGNHTKAKFTWDTTGVYAFARSMIAKQSPRASATVII